MESNMLLSYVSRTTFSPLYYSWPAFFFCSCCCLLRTQFGNVTNSMHLFPKKKDIARHTQNKMIDDSQWRDARHMSFLMCVLCNLVNFVIKIHFVFKTLWSLNVVWKILSNACVLSEKSCIHGDKWYNTHYVSRPHQTWQTHDVRWEEKNRQIQILCEEADS